jgi:diguanylate cyclase
VLSIAYVIPFVLPCVLIGVGVGVYLGRNMALAKAAVPTESEKEATLKALLTLLKSAEQLTTDVDSHSNELKHVGRTVGDLHLSGELEQVQSSLLGQIAAVLEANQRLEDDLVCTKYRLEEQAQELDRTRREARTDVLSGVGNRKAFDERLQFTLSKFNRQKTPFALVLADVDHFKWINDTHGHQAGDQVVTNIGNVLQQSVRDTDFVARFGGDEFALLLSGIEGELATEIAERIRRKIERSNFNVGPENERVAVTFSMGLAAAREGDNAETLLERADRALYTSKESGRNQLRCYEAEGELVKVGA